MLAMIGITAIMQRETKLVTIAHQDDIYDPTYLESMLQTVNRFPEDETLLAFSDYYELREGSRVDTNKLLTIKRILNAPLKIGAILSQICS
mgnify:CR=1 FL=1